MDPLSKDIPNANIFMLPGLRITGNIHEQAMDLKRTFWGDVVQPTGEVDESCTFEKLGDEHGLHAHCLTIQEHSSGSRELVSEVKAFVYVNAEAAEYIRTQSIWKDPRLFLLSQIRDAFIARKIVKAGFREPEETETATRDSSTGAITYVTIRARVLYPTGSPFIPVANYGNTHIKDQVQKIIDINPASEPSAVELQRRVAEVIEKARAAKVVSVAAQKEALSGLPPAGSWSLSLFVDETGDLSYKTAAEFYGVCGTLIETLKVPAVRTRLRNLVSRHWKQSPDRLHLTKLAAPRKRKKLEQVTAELAEIFKEDVETAVLIVAQNVNFLKHLLRCEAERNKTLDRPVETNFGDLLAEPENQVNRKRLILANEELVTHFGLESLKRGASLSIVHDRKNKQWMNEALSSGFERCKASIAFASQKIYGESLCPEMEFGTLPSHEEPCLWLSDWIAWETGNWIRGGEPTPGFISIQISLQIVTYGDEGDKLLIDSLGGEIVSRFEDLPREISTIL